jgi:peroxin-1
MKLAPDVDLRAVAEHCKDFSGADLQAVLTTAQLNAVHALLDASVPAESNSEDTETAPEIYVTAEHVQAAVSAARLSVSAADRARFARIYGEFTGSRQKAPQEATEKPTGVGSRVTQM